MILIIAYLVPWPVVRLPFGQTLEQPRRTQELHGSFLSHFSFSLRHSAQEISPRARLISISSSVDSLRNVLREAAGFRTSAGIKM